MIRLALLATITFALLFAQPAQPATTRQHICQVFKTYCWQAVRVARCESGLRTWARNGQYLGLFQMGSWARARYGHSSTARGQAISAYRYFVASGRDWSPWTCKP